MSFTRNYALLAAGSTGNVITLVGTGTAWVNGVTVFSVTGGTGASVTSNTVTDTTHATVTVTPGTTVATLTLSDGLGNTNTLTVAVATAEQNFGTDSSLAHYVGSAAFTVSGGVAVPGTHNVFTANSMAVDATQFPYYTTSGDMIVENDYDAAPVSNTNQNICVVGRWNDVNNNVIGYLFTNGTGTSNYSLVIRVNIAGTVSQLSTLAVVAPSGPFTLRLGIQGTGAAMQISLGMFITATGVQVGATLATANAPHLNGSSTSSWGSLAYYSAGTKVNVVAMRVYTAAATSLQWTGPTTGPASLPSQPFTTNLVGIAPSTITDTYGDSGAGGSFSPTTATFTSGKIGQLGGPTTVYTSNGNGTFTLTASNTSGVTPPGNLTYTAGPALTFSGPSTCVTGTASSNFSIGTTTTPLDIETVTPHSTDGMGYFIPSSVVIGPSTSLPVTVQYVAGVAGAATLSLTASGALIAPAPLTCTATQGWYPLYTEDFTTATDLSLFTAYSSGSWQVYNGRLQTPTSPTPNYLAQQLLMSDKRFWLGNLRMRSYFDAVPVAGQSQSIEMALRAIDSNNYILCILSISGTTLTTSIRPVVNGSVFTTINGSAVTLPVGTGWSWEITMVGLAASNCVMVFYNGDGTVITTQTFSVSELTANPAGWGWVPNLTVANPLVAATHVTKVVVSAPTPVTYTAIPPVPASAVTGVQSQPGYIVVAGTPATNLVFTFSDNSGGGTFGTGTTITVNAGTTNAIVPWTYGPVSTGAKSVSITQNQQLLDPGAITITGISGAATTVGIQPAPGYIGVAAIASQPFTIAMDGTHTSFVATLVDASGGTWTPATVTLSTASPAATATLIRAGAASGAVSVTNTAGLTNSPGVVYTTVADTRALVLTSPVTEMVVQRNRTTNVSQLPIIGNIVGGIVGQSIEASFNGGAFVTVATGVLCAFSGLLSAPSGTPAVPAGQGSVVVRVVGSTSINKTVTAVGAGEIVPLFGQSNGFAELTNNQVVATTYPTGPLTASLYNSAGIWVACGDPTSGLGAGGSTGSWLPLLAGSLMGALGCPVGVINRCVVGTSVTPGQTNPYWFVPSKPYDRSTMYGAAVIACLQAGGVGIVLWQQGESDEIGTAGYQTAVLAYRRAISAAFLADVGSLMMSNLIHLNGSTFTDQNIINPTITSAHSLGYELAGPDLTVMGIATGPNPPTNTGDKLHINTDAKALIEEGLWFGTVGTALQLTPVVPGTGGWQGGLIIGVGIGV